VAPSSSGPDGKDDGEAKDGAGRPASSTFHGEKWLSGVNGVPYLAVMPSEASATTAKRKASGNSRR